MGNFKEIKYTYKFRLELTKKEEKQFFNSASTDRYLYNLALEQRNHGCIPGPVPTLLEIHQQREANKLAGIKPVKKNVNFSAPLVNKGITLKYQGLQLKFLRGAVDWIADASSPCEEAVLKALDTAFKNFFDRVKKGVKVSNGKNPFGYPVFHGRYHRLSLHYKPGLVSIKEPSRKAGGTGYFGYLKVPKFKEPIPFRQNRPVLGEQRTVTISRESDGNWYVCILTIQTIPDTTPPKNQIGIDLGVKNTIATSDGVIYPNTLKHKVTEENQKKLEKKIRKEQQKLNRKQKGSKNEAKLRKKIAKKQFLLKSSRNSTTHEITNELTKNNDQIGKEKLDIKSMTKNVSGTILNPGTNVALTSTFNHAMLARNWGEIDRQIDYKFKWKGGELVRVDPKYTSTKCSQCGYIDKENRKTQEKFKCLDCGHKENADINAAKNIKKDAFP